MNRFIASIGIFILRLSVSILFYFNFLNKQLQLAWLSVWKNQRWQLIETLAENKFMMSTILAYCLIVLLTLIIVFIFFGFITRIACFIFIIIIVLYLIYFPSDGIGLHIALLYLSFAVTLLFTGSGKISLDTKKNKSLFF